MKGYDSLQRPRSLLIFSSLLTGLLLSVAVSAVAQVDAEYEVIARSGATLVPGSSSTFNGFGAAPAIDAEGNVVFTGGGGGLAGVYTSIGYCCQIVADTQTPIPGGGGATFYDFSGEERHDIDGGRVAFKAMESPFYTGLYSNVGQSAASTLRKIAGVDGQSWDELGDPWVDGEIVSVYGVRPAQTYEILLWDGSNLSTNLLDPGAGFNIAYNTQASISSDAAVFLRFSSNAYELAVSLGDVYETLAIADETQMPGMGGDIFQNFYHHPVVDRAGLDVAFLGYGNYQGLFKRVDGGALQHVADNSMMVPGSAYEQITLIDQAGIAMANGQVVFLASTSYLEQGIYTDLGGELATLLDTGSHDTIVLDGQTERISGLSLGTRGFAYGPDGYMVVFKADLMSGGSAIIKAFVPDGPGGLVDGTFTVYKDYSDDNSDWVYVTASCSSGTISNNPWWIREGAPAVFQITGAEPGTTCTAVETSVAAGYTKDESDCQDNDPLNGSCTIVNTLDSGSGTFTVFKDFSDNSSAAVTFTATCSSGTVTNSPQQATEGSPAVFNVTGALAGTTCTATEPTVPAGYTRNQIDCQDGDPLSGSCTIVNTLNTSSGTFTVFKDFSDNSPAAVTFTASCSSGMVTNSPQQATEGSPAVFNVTGALAGTTCTATEPTVPAGYTRNQTDCLDGDPLNTSCTIVNTALPAADTFSVFTDFSDDNATSVSVSAICSSGTVTNNPQPSSEASPAVFSVSGASPGTTCSATANSAPAGYAINEADCQSGRPLNESCVLVNTFIPSGQQQQVAYDGFEDGDANGWVLDGDANVTGGTAIGQSSLRLRRSSSATWPVSTAGFSDVSIEMRMAASSLESGDSCVAEYSLNGGGSWVTLLVVDSTDSEDLFYLGAASPAAADNNPNLRLRFRSTGRQPNDYCYGDEVRVLGTSSAGTAGSFVVRKDFSDDNAASVNVSLSCSSGSVTNSPQSASESVPAVFFIEGQAPGATCSALESGAPSGYTADESDCQDGDLADGACTIVNSSGQTVNGTFTVRKDFSDNSAAAVTFTANCSSGTVTNSPQQATEGSPAVFNVTGALAGTTCTASEPSVPAGYTRDQSDCQDGDSLNTFCTIVNTLDTQQEVDILYSNFESGQSDGWSLGANVAVESGTAVGQYALRVRDDGTASVRAVSTAGYSDVSITMRMAANSLESSDTCLAEYSINGGGSWTTLLQLDSGDPSGVFLTASSAPALASNNPDLRLRIRVSGKGKNDDCLGDEIRVSGMP